VTVVTVPRTPATRAERVAEVETGAAWARYLADTRDLDSLRYEELEPWAWDRLQATLHAISLRGARR
jgi:hypothetical protein